MALDISPALARLLAGPADISALADACHLPANIEGSRWRELHDALRAHPAVIVEESPRLDDVRRYRLRHPGEPAMCRDTKDRLLCTLAPGHVGDHEAHGTGPGDIIATWPR